ncbi:uncharacterized protein LOC110815496 [Carica papaya]|uniref:uncharacterized protein LOC110815496 n=1 Tax=Carica papaya TaxID=3649 RepID=UPI000B8CCAA7|nr:uncharacterized protein LOC110815496 [Carica papaya]
MAAASFLKNLIPFVFALTFTTIFCSQPLSGYSEDVPGERIAKALFCFDNHFIYSECEKEYRLNESGNLNVPFAANNIFCNGPCLVETQLVLNCVDNILSNFLFYNKATVRDLRNTVRAGCSFTSRRGNFNVGNYLQGEISRGNALSLPNSIRLFASAIVITGVLLILPV